MHSEKVERRKRVSNFLSASEQQQQLNNKSPPQKIVLFLLLRSNLFHWQSHLLHLEQRFLTCGSRTNSGM